MLNRIKSLFTSFNKKTKFSFSVKYLDDLKYFNQARKIFNLIEKENYKSMFVGGCVRKLIRGEKIDDVDIATNINPINLKKIFKKNKIKFIETGISHGTITALIKNYKFEITTLRKDISTDGRHANVEFISDWKNDAQRRDFTFNAIYSNLRGEIYDPQNGFDDLRNNLIRFVGNPAERIKEDYLRILRYIRFFTQYSKHEHSKEIIKAIKVNLGDYNKVSKERSLEELFKIVTLKNVDELFNNEFSNFVFLSIFPQLKYGSRLHLLKKNSKNILERLNKVLLISILLIDEKDNAQFFLYKYNLSKEMSKKIIFIDNILKKKPINELIEKKNLLKLCYLYGKIQVIELIIFLIFNEPKRKKNLEKLLNEIEGISIPDFKINANYLKNNFGFSDGKELGLAIKKLEEFWMNNNFEIQEDKIKGILNI